MRKGSSAEHHFDLQVIADPDDTFGQRVVATPTTVLPNPGEPRRAVHGIVTACTATGRNAAGMATLERGGAVLVRVTTVAIGWA